MRLFYFIKHLKHRNTSFNYLAYELYKIPD